MRKEYTNDVINTLTKNHSEAMFEVANTYKNNDAVKNGIVVKFCNTNVSPLIYITEDDFCKPVEETAEKIWDLALKNKRDKLDISNKLSKEYILDNLFIKVVNKKTNLQNLKRWVSFDGLLNSALSDLTAIFEVSVGNINGGYGSITLTKEIINYLKLDEKELIRYAKIREPKLITMDKLVRSILEKQCLPDFMIDEIINNQPMPDMLILSNEEGLYGAAILTHPEEIAKILDENNVQGAKFVIVPSSVHEVIVLPPEATTLDVEELNELVKKVNGSDLKPEEVLSDHVYIFNKEEKTFETLGI